MMRAALLVLVLGLLALPRAAMAQNYSIDSISGMDLGRIVSAASGTTIFVIPADGGAIQKSGQAVRLAGGSSSARALVTVSCGNQASCATDQPLVTVAASGSPTGRADAISRFSASTSGATASFAAGSAPSAAPSLSFALAPVGKNMSRTFYIGYELGIAGDNSGRSSGPASSGFTITLSRGNGTRTEIRGGDISVDVLRTLNASAVRNLAFGRIIPPTSGTGVATLAPGQATVGLSGAGMAALSGSAAATALFDISGEGGQVLSVSIPTQFSLSNGTSSLTVDTISNASGSLTLPGTSGTEGSASVEVGGALAIASDAAGGDYTGSFSVVFQYN